MKLERCLGLCPGMKGHQLIWRRQVIRAATRRAVHSSFIGSRAQKAHASADRSNRVALKTHNRSYHTTNGVLCRHVFLTSEGASTLTCHSRSHDLGIASLVVPRDFCLARDAWKHCNAYNTIHKWVCRHYADTRSSASDHGGQGVSEQSTERTSLSPSQYDIRDRTVMVELVEKLA